MVGDIGRDGFLHARVGDADGSELALQHLRLHRSAVGPVALIATAIAATIADVNVGGILFHGGASIGLGQSGQRRHKSDGQQSGQEAHCAREGKVEIFHGVGRENALADCGDCPSISASLASAKAKIA